MKQNYQKAEARYLSFAQMLPYINEQIRAGGSVELPVRGRSMRPMLREGKDTVILSGITKPLKTYDIPLYHRADGVFVLHRIIRIGNGEYTCMGDNQFTPETGLKEEQMLAVLTAFRRGKRLVKITSLAYRLYRWVWCHSRSLRFFLFRVKRKLRRIFSSRRKVG